nr:MAG TPA: hypothetical protein [Bacteriophage sp.]DAJ83412.1 MAG TPA: hypothetical protein [Bacteriophage sp.]DAN56514.1 MAG TPA: hypothetical protein [Bacteriophage sp.]
MFILSCSVFDDRVLYISFMWLWYYSCCLYLNFILYT